MKQQVREEWKTEQGFYKCPHCDKVKTKKQLASHLWLSHTEEGKLHRSKLTAGLKGRKAWNKGLAKETDSRVAEYAKVRRVKLEKGLLPTNKGKKLKHNPEWVKALSERQSLNNTGGKAKWYSVGDQRVQGTWERDLALKLNELGCKWRKFKTNKDIVKYVDQKGKVRSYTPDLFLEEFDLILEVKGYWWGSDKIKMRLVLEQNENLRLKIRIIEKNTFNNLLKASNKGEFLKILGALVNQVITAD